MYELIVAIVNKGVSSDVIAASRSAGATGATVLHGKGAGIKDEEKFFGIVIEPEKEIVLTLVNPDITDAVLAAISKAIEIEKPGHGIAFVVDITKTIGLPNSGK